MRFDGSFFQRFREAFLSKAAALSVSALIAGGGLASKAYGLVKTTIEQVQENKKRLEKVEGERAQEIDELRRISSELRKLQSQNSTLYGLGIISSAGTDESWVAVNLHSPAARFTDGQILSITSLIGEQRSIPVKVKGSFQNASAAYLVKLSRKAAAELELENENEVRIRVEPHDPEDET